MAERSVVLEVGSTSFSIPCLSAMGVCVTISPILYRTQLRKFVDTFLEYSV